MSLQVSGQRGVTTDDISAVVVKISATNATDSGELVAYARGDAVPGGTSLVHGSGGIRSTKNGPDVDASNQWDRSAPLPMLSSETTASMGTTYCIYGPAGLPVEQINEDNSVYFIHHDQLGSTRMITNVPGDAVATFVYDAYGNEIANSGTARTLFGFAGQYSDAKSGPVVNISFGNGAECFRCTF